MLTKRKARWEKSSTCIYNIFYHIIFCPKYRAAILVDQVEKRLKNLIIEKWTYGDNARSCTFIFKTNPKLRPVIS